MNHEIPGNWRFMQRDDLAEVSRIAAAVHPDFPEDDIVLGERLKLFPEGCFVLKNKGELGGYLLTHPWRAFDIPPLNTLLGSLPPDPETYYLHDIALMPEMRSKGEVSPIIRYLLQRAKGQRLASCSLVAVNNSQDFWSRLGFVEARNEELDGKLQSYDEAARFMVHRF